MFPTMQEQSKVGKFSEINNFMSNNGQHIEVIDLSDIHLAVCCNV